MDSWRIISGGDDKTLKVCLTNEFSCFLQKGWKNFMWGASIAMCHS